MSTKEETILQRQVMVRLSEAGFTPIRQQVGTFYSNTGMPIRVGLNGLPDVMVLRYGGVFWIEMKTTRKGSKLRDDQVKFHAFLNKLGHHVYTVRTLEDLEEVIKCEAD